MKTTSNTYLVTARHRLVSGAADGPRWRPYGVHHARRAGDPFTVCGIPAIEWRMFWTTEFDGNDDQACPACAMLLVWPPLARSRTSAS